MRFYYGIFYVYSDETDRIQKRAVRLSLTDEMTGLYNWRFIRNNVQRDLNKSLETGVQCSVLMIDIDNFKKINDKYGHQAGDKALKMIAGILKTSVRSIDVVGRYGGDEFFVMLPNINAQNAETIAERIRMTVEETFIKYGMPLTVSIGVADVEGGSLEEIFMNADKNMYNAKNTGKNKVRRALYTKKGC
jgi:diguanylate cyclase (GGDEF)-like protein